MRIEQPAVRVALAAVLVDTIGFGIVGPVLPQLLMHLGHVGIDQATRIGGYMLIVFAAMQFVAGPIIGNLSDRFGRRPVLIASMLCFGMDYALMAWAPTIAWLFLGRAIAGVSGAVYGPAGSVIADVVPAEKRSATYALVGAAFGFGFIIGPALGGLLAHWGPRAPFIASAVLALLNALAMVFLLPETLADANRRPFRLRDAHIVGAFRPLFDAGNAGPLLLATFLFQLAHMVYPATWGFWATARFGWTASDIGWSLAFVGLTMAGVQAGLTGPVIARIGERRALLVGMVCGASAFLCYAFAWKSWQAYALFLLSAPSGFVMAATQGLLSRMVDASRQGALQGGMGSMNSMAAIVGPLLLTQALAYGIERGFAGAGFLLASLLGFAAAAVIMVGVLGRVPRPAE